MIVQIINVYIIIGIITSLILARHYTFKWRETPSKQNIILQSKLANRLVDSIVFLIAYAVIVFLYPIYILEIIIKKEKLKLK